MYKVMNMSLLDTVSATPLETPGTLAFFQGKTVAGTHAGPILARYCQGDATLNGDKISAGQAGLLIAPGASWDTPNYHYIATNTDSGAGNDENIVVAAGFAWVDLVENYWGWLVVRGYMTGLLCTATTDFDGNPEFGKIAIASNATILDKCTAHEDACVYTDSNGTGSPRTVTGWVSIPQIW